MTNKIPIKIENSENIVSAIFELRFKNDLPNGEFFSLIYPELVKEFGKLLVNSNSPKVTLPDGAIPIGEGNLNFMTHYSLTNDRINLRISETTINVPLNIPYSSWIENNPLIKSIIKIFYSLEPKLMIDRVGIRFINFFENQLLPILDFDIKFNDKIKMDSTNDKLFMIRNFKYKGFDFTLHITNNVQFLEKEHSEGILIDIDGSKTFNDFQNLEDFIKIIQKLKRNINLLFYSLLTDKFVKKLGPEYAN